MQGRAAIPDGLNADRDLEGPDMRSIFAVPDDRRELPFIANIGHKVAAVNYVRNYLRRI